jgi:VanZ family protein
MNARRPAWAWLFFAQLALVILATVLATLGCFPTVLFRAPFDKVGHLFAYGLLSFLAVSFFGHERRWRVVGALLVAATLEELSQRFFPTRTFDPGDLAMNVLGITVFGAIAAARGAARHQRPSFELDPARELEPIERGVPESVDVALLRQCGEEAGVRTDVVSARRELAGVRAAGETPVPDFGVGGWFVVMFAVLFILVLWAGAALR